MDQLGPTRKVSKKKQKNKSTFEVDLFSQFPNLCNPFDRPILNPSTSRYTFYVQLGRKHLLVRIFWIVNGGDQCYSHIHEHLQQVDSCWCHVCNTYLPF